MPKDQTKPAADRGIQVPRLTAPVGRRSMCLRGLTGLLLAVLILAGALGTQAALGSTRSGAASKPSPTAVLAQLRGQVRAAARAQRHGKTLARSRYEKINRLARELEALIKKGPSRCRSSLVAARHLLGDRRHQIRLRSDLKHAQAGIGKCVTVLLISPTQPGSGPKAPETVVQSYTSHWSIDANGSTPGPDPFTGTGSATQDETQTSGDGSSLAGTCAHRVCEISILAGIVKVTRTDTGHMTYPPTGVTCGGTHGPVTGTRIRPQIGTLTLKYTVADQLYSATVTGGPQFSFYVNNEDGCVSFNPDPQKLPTLGPRRLDVDALNQGDSVDVDLTGSGSRSANGGRATLDYHATERFSFRLVPKDHK